MINRILIPVDVSDNSLRAARYGVRLAKELGANVFSVHVVEAHPYKPLLYYLIGGADREIEKDIRENVEKSFNKVERFAEQQDVKIDFDIIFRSKSVVESIISHATKKKIDIIVIRRKGRSGLKKIITGSIARSVAENADCPVLLVQ